jgi:SAM-dependent methyltransferase
MKRDQQSQVNARLYEGYSVPMKSLEVQQFTELLAGEIPGNILDLGCADGQFAEHIGHLGWIPYGNDISKTNIASANARGVCSVMADLQHSFPYRSLYFDAVLAKQVCEHLADTRHFFMECRRVLRPGGILLIGTPNLANLSNRIRLLFGLYPVFMDYEMEGKYGHVRYYTLSVLCGQLRMVGFKIVAIRGGVLPVPILSRVFRSEKFRPLKVLGNLFPTLSDNLVVKAQKI